MGMAFLQTLMAKAEDQESEEIKANFYKNKYRKI